MTVLAVSACSLVYSGYDDRFASSTPASTDAQSPFVTDDGSITEITVANSEVFYTVAGDIRRVHEDGGARDVWWSGDAGNAVVSLASDGTTAISWSYGSDVSVKNRLFLGQIASSADATEIEEGAAVGDYLDEKSVAAWSLSATPANCTVCPLAHARAAQGGSITTLDLVLDGGSGDRGAVSARAIAVDSASIDVLLQPARFMRFAFDGSVECSTVGFAANAAGVAATPDGSSLFLITGTSPGQGSLARYDAHCPSPDGGVVLDSNASLVVADGSAVYWSTNDGRIFRAGFRDASGTQIGATTAAPNAIAIGAVHLYAAVGSSIFRFPKSP